MDISNPALTISSVEPIFAKTSPAPALDPVDWMAGASMAMTQLRAQIRRIAPYFRTALLTGEEGCGEVAAAQMLHELSPRRAEPFFELTAAAADRLPGGQDSYASLLRYGMLYLPHPEQMSWTIQRALLRLLRERGAQAPRMVAFAERGVRLLVSGGGFLAELADALGALRITLPPLRERREDLPALLTQILTKLAERAGGVAPELGPDLLEAAKHSPWPGNFPQMQAVAERLILLKAKGILRGSDLNAVLGGLTPAPPRERRVVPMVSLDTVIQDHIRAVLLACNGNKLRTAEVLGISRSTLYRMLGAQGTATLSLATNRMSMVG